MQPDAVGTGIVGVAVDGEAEPAFVRHGDYASLDTAISYSAPQSASRAAPNVECLLHSI